MSLIGEAFGPEAFGPGVVAPEAATRREAVAEVSGVRLEDPQAAKARDRSKTTEIGPAMRRLDI
jgi:hypothetical protein